MNTTTIQTAAGAFTAHFSERGLCRLEFPQAGRSGRANPAAPGPWPRETRRWLALTSQALNRALVGKDPTRLPPFDLSAGTAFQQRVWQALLKIPAGRFRTYAKLAAAVGHPKAARAVGGACGANPIPVLVPCHRVLAASGGLGGYSGGLDWKRRLLAGEGVRPA